MNVRVIRVARLLSVPGRHRSQKNIGLRISKGHITTIGPAKVTGRGRSQVALPAFVNAHDHGYGISPLALGAKDDALECWIAGLATRVSIDPWLEAIVAFGRMALSGIGSTVHCHNSLVANKLMVEAPAVWKAARDIGIRVAFSCPIADRNTWVYGGAEKLLPFLSSSDRMILRRNLRQPEPAEEQVARVEEIAEAYETELFQVQYGPIGPQWCKDQTLELIAEASMRSNRRVHMHLLESKRQREWFDSKYKGGIIRHLDNIGLLSKRLTIAHGVYLTEEECALLAERGVTVAVNTSSNLRLRSGVAPIHRFRRHGLRFAFGLDGSAIDDDQDYLKELRLAWNLHSGTGLQNEFPPTVLFEAALKDGFTVIDGSRDYGKIKPGARADLVLLNYGSMTQNFIVENTDEIEMLLTLMSTRHVERVIVSGREIVQDGKLLGVNFHEAEAELISQARKCIKVSKNQLGLIRRHREAIRRYYSSMAHCC